MQTFAQLVPKLSRDMMDTALLAAFELAEAVYIDTPVDTHLLEESWIASVNRYAPTVTQVSSTEGWESIWGRAELGDTLHLINYQPYVRRIEYTGHSPQAPDGMMWKNIARWSSIVENSV